MKKMLCFVVLLGIFLHNVAGAIHSLKYFYTASSGLKNFPEFVTVGMVDDQPISYYDSVIRKETPKQDWMAETEGREYWEINTQVSIGNEQTFKANIDVIKQRFNQTGGVHIFQQMYGCEWDDETGSITGFEQFGYDGEDFIILNMKTNTYIAPRPQAVVTTNRVNHDKVLLEEDKNYYNQRCPEWLKKYVNYGRSSLIRTDLPSVSLLQKSSSSPISCFATGFYPNRAEMFWRKDGAEIHDGVEKGEILPNNDGTFQMNVDLNLPSSEDWTKYECVFQLFGVDRDVITPLDKTKIRTNEVSGNLIGIIIGVVIAALLVLVFIIAGVILWWKKRDNGFKRANTSDTSSTYSDELYPKKVYSEGENLKFWQGSSLESFDGRKDNGFKPVKISDMSPASSDGSDPKKMNSEGENLKVLPRYQLHPLLAALLGDFYSWFWPPSFLEWFVGRKDIGFKPANTSDTSFASSDGSNPKKMNSEEEKMMKIIS